MYKKEKTKKRLKLISILIAMLVLLILSLYSCSGKNHIHYKNDNYCFVHVQIGSRSTLEDYSGTMSVSDYKKWVNGDTGTVFIYMDKNAKYGVRLNISSITHISNYGNTPYAYD